MTTKGSNNSLSVMLAAHLPATADCPPRDDLLRIGVNDSQADELRRKHAAHIAACDRCRAIVELPSTPGPFRRTSEAENRAAAEAMVAGLSRDREPAARWALSFAPRADQGASEWALAAHPAGALPAQRLEITVNVLPLELSLGSATSVISRRRMCLKPVRGDVPIELMSDATGRVVFDGAAGEYEIEVDGYVMTKLSVE